MQQDWEMIIPPPAQFLHTRKKKTPTTKQNNIVSSERWWHEEIFSQCQIQKSRIIGTPVAATLIVRISAMPSTLEKLGVAFTFFVSVWLAQMTQAPTKGWDSTLTAVALELLFHHHWNGKLSQSFLWKQELLLLEHKPKVDFMTEFGSPTPFLSLPGNHRL